MDFKQSLPSWERGLKQQWIFRRATHARSLPSWERGLKQLINRRPDLRQCGRSLRGSVD